MLFCAFMNYFYLDYISVKVKYSCRWCRHISGASLLENCTSASKWHLTWPPSTFLTYLYFPPSAPLFPPPPSFALYAPFITPLSFGPLPFLVPSPPKRERVSAWLSGEERWVLPFQILFQRSSSSEECHQRANGGLLSQLRERRRGCVGICEPWCHMLQTRRGQHTCSSSHMFSHDPLFPLLLVMFVSLVPEVTVAAQTDTARGARLAEGPWIIHPTCLYALDRKKESRGGAEVGTAAVEVSTFLMHNVL